MWRFGLPCFLVVLLLYGAFTFINYTTDDPFITFRYADNIVAGEGPVYNPGEHVEGYSNPSWLMMMTLVSAMLPGNRPLAMLWVAKLLGVLLTVGTVLVVYAAERRAAPDRTPLASIFLAANPCMWVWSVGGLEAPLCAFLVAVVVYDEVVKGGSLIGASAVGVLAVTRPEMPLLLLVYLIYRWQVKRVPPWRHRPAFLLAVVPLVLYLAFRVWFFSDIFPNTYYAKAASHDWLAGGGYLWKSLKQFHMWWTMLPLLVIGLLAPRRPGRRLVLSFLVAYTLFIAASGGDWMPAARFQVNIAPLLAWVVADGYDRLADWTRLRKGLLFVFVIVPVMLVGMLLISQRIEARFGISPWPWERLSWESPVFPHYLEMGKWLRENVAPDEYVALGEAGIMPYVGRVRIIDCFGLMDPHIARLPGRMHYKFDANYVLWRSPQYILLLTRTDGDEFNGKFFFCRVLWRHPVFHEQYELAHRVRDLWLFRRKPDV